MQHWATTSQRSSSDTLRPRHSRRSGRRCGLPQARALLDDAQPAAPPSDRNVGSETAVFKLEGDTRIVTFGGRTAYHSDLKGFRYLALLLAKPDREIHVLDMVAAEQGRAPVE